MSHRFKVGDRVIITENYDGRPTANEIATITHVESPAFYEVEFDNPHYNSYSVKYPERWFVPNKIIEPYQSINYDETWI